MTTSAVKSRRNSTTYLASGLHVLPQRNVMLIVAVPIPVNCVLFEYPFNRVGRGEEEGTHIRGMRMDHLPDSNFFNVLALV